MQFTLHRPMGTEWDPRTLPGMPGRMSKEKRLKARDKRKKLKKH